MAAGCLLRDRLEELWLHIAQLHLTYLEADESPRKLDEKKRLEAYIREYLCIAPHDRKFCLDATREVLHRSVESKEDFSAYRATQAWTAIAAYAQNLLAQPWRKEFHEIKTYCGYYKHHVQSGLVGAELILEAMGYKRTSQSSLVLDGPVDPDRVSIVSQDSLIALVECQIIRTIYAEVLKLIPTCSWSDVLRFREQHAGSPEQAITCLNYRLRQEQYQPPLTHLDSCGAMARYPYPHPYATNRYYNYSYPQPRYTHTVISPIQPYPPHPHPPHPHPHYYDQYYGYYPVKNGCVPPSPLVTCSVPTAQLIELDPPSDPIVSTHRRSSSDHRIESEYRKNSSVDRYSTDMYNNRHHTISDDISSSRKDKNKDWDNWDFVYKTLEGKRGGITDDGLPPVNATTNERWDRRDVKCNNVATPIELDEALKAFSLDDLHQITVPDQRVKKSNEPVNKLSNIINEDAQSVTRSTSSISRRDIYTGGEVSPLVPTNDNGSNIPTSPKHHAQTTVRPQKKNELLKEDQSKFLSVDARRLRVKLTDEKWECVTCTFHNSVSREVCEMCGKSKKVGDESRPLASGGRQCPQCTLVNEKGVTTCEVCGNCLKDSPTYI
ncbi:PUB and ZnF_RBZ domain-containing protein tamozhennic [Lycorma delicatula]|uniref:PUB and ZnF_RBZ domain-containing protein tamozhennic n=1 Tax=Lycorma delicatula TaxID=130591 RepID=UPI003F51782E